MWYTKPPRVDSVARGRDGMSQNTICKPASRQTKVRRVQSQLETWRSSDVVTAAVGLVGSKAMLNTDRE
jgi:hypothetical protein